MVDAVFAARFTPDLDDRAACIATSERHNPEVRRAESFPRTNTSEEFLARFNSRPGV
jgi:hypothetical protein